MNLPPRAQVLGLLGQDLVGEIPGQKQDVIGPPLGPGRAGMDGRSVPGV